jgi:hypothetical protein
MKPLPNGLIIAMSVGVLSGFILGIFVYSQANHEQLVFEDGPSISIVTEKIDFELGEQVYIRIVNSGTIPLTFPDASYGLSVIGLDGVLYYKPIAAQVLTTLEPNEDTVLIWNQKKIDGSDSLEGVYKIVVEGFDLENNNVKRSVTINVLK